MIAILFAVAPVLSMSFAAPAGAFSAVVVHSHDGGDKDHSHHSHRSHGHDHDHSGSTTDDGLDPLSDGGSHHGEGTAHVHHDAWCPSVLVPTPVADLPERRPGRAFAHSLTQSLRGASPDNLLRPPISHLHI